MKKIQYEDLTSLSSGDHVAIAADGEMFSVWEIPQDTDFFDEILGKLNYLGEDYDFFQVDVKGVSGVSLLNNWYCYRSSEFAYKAFDRKNYYAVKNYIRDNNLTILKVV